MPGRTPGVVLKDLQTLFQVGTTGDLTDGQLIERFLSQRDNAGEAAFRALVERHAPMVSRVCRKILGDWHAAQDASQATFIVLARKAGSIHKRDSVASWLFGVACRISAQARASAVRRQRHEERCASLARRGMVKEHAYDPWLDLHHEIARLPPRLREPLVLCYFEGHSQREAAAWLGCPVRTLENRLAEAKERMRNRLARHRPFAAFETLAAFAGSDGSPAPATPAWLATTVQAAVTAARLETTRDMVSATVTALTEGMLHMMFRAKLKSVAAAVLASGALTLGIGLIATSVATSVTQAAPGRDAAHEGAKEPVRAPNGEIIVRAFELSRDRDYESLNGIVAIDPETGTWRAIYKGMSIGPGRISPDGRYFVFSSLGRDTPDDETGIFVYDMTGNERTRRIFDRKGEPFWTSGGRQVIVGTQVGPKTGKFETWRVNADGTRAAKLPLPDTDLVLDCSGDGTWIATRTMRGDPQHEGRLTLVHPDGSGAHELTEGSANGDLFSVFSISPDSRRVAYVQIKTVNDMRQPRLFIVNVDGKNRREIPMTFEPDTTPSVFWSPDGSRLALNPMSGKTKEGSINIVDLDGSSFRNVPLPPGRWNVQVCDWKSITPDMRAGAPDRTGNLNTPRGRYQALISEINKAAESYEKVERGAKTREERAKIHRERLLHGKLYAKRFMEIAESAPDDPAGVDALIWVVKFGDAIADYSRAIDLLVQRHAKALKVAHAALAIQGHASPATERLIRAVAQNSPEPYFRGLASLALGRHLKAQSDRVREIRDDPQAAKAWETSFIVENDDKAGFSELKSRDPDAMLKEAETIFERIDNEFARLSKQADRLSQRAFSELVAHAAAELNEIQDLCPGKPAPEITGKDIDGKPFKLSDYRGKVVCLCFWADWCGGCRAMIPLERSLVDAMTGKPFALLGVNGDGEIEKVQDLVKAERITWRSWFDGRGDDGTGGSISRQFNVRTWPTVYLIDCNGIIRQKLVGNTGAKRIRSTVDALVASTPSKAFPADDRAKTP